MKSEKLSMKNYYNLIILLILNSFSLIHSMDHELTKVYVILSQNNKLHSNLGNKLKNELESEASSVVYFSNQFYPHEEHWIVLPLLPNLLSKHSDNTSWFIFLHDNTHVNVKILKKVLQKYDPNKEVLLGYSVFDREPSIIHHFDFNDGPENFTYPISSPGFAMSNYLLKTIGKKMLLKNLSNDFSIDFIYEMAKIIWDNGNGIKVTHEPTFCLSESNNCATYPIIYYPCHNGIPKDSLYFAVKTFHGFHNERLTVVKNTWAKHVHNLGIYSDVTDDNYGTISIGVPNSERGHCIKTMKIIEHVSQIMKNNKKLKWLFIVDDDTILSVERVRQFVSCYDYSEDIAIGERYGYDLMSGLGYNYLTGGAGILLSKTLVEKLSKNKCHCPSLLSPDDMVLGLCLKKLQAEIIHSPYFHQARPADYTKEYLNTKKPITFHKYWMQNPLKIYEEWFSKDDKVIALEKEEL